MAEEFIVHGDAESLIIYILKNLTPELVDQNIKFSTDLIGYTAGSRHVEVSQEGSSKAGWNIINKPRVDISVRAERRSVARAIAEVIEASIFRAVGTQYAGCSLSQVKEETGIMRVPDIQEVNSHRYLFALRLVVLQDTESLSNPFLD